MSFEDLRTVDGEVFPTFQEAASHIGLFHNEAEDMFCLSEAIAFLYTPRQLWHLFVNLLTNDCCHSPCSLWSKFCLDFARDFLVKDGYDKDTGFNLSLQEMAGSL